MTPTPADAAFFRDVGAKVIAQLEREQGISPSLLKALREAKGATP